jgi:quercetin dioxygenase-like cupin family protein
MNNITHIFGDREVAKKILLKSGDVVVQHKHNYDHIAILAFGTVQLTNGDNVEIITGPHELVIPKQTHHGVKALTDAVWYCIHGDTTQNDDVLIDKTSSNESSAKFYRDKL